MNSYHIRTNSQSIRVHILRKKMKTVRLKVHRDGQVVLSAPYAVTDRWIKQYIEGKTDWIQKQLDRVHPGNCAIPPVIENGARIRILGDEYAIRIEPSGKNAVALTDNRLVIFCRTPDQEALSRQLDRWWRRAAMDRFTSSLHKYYPIVEAQGVGMPRLAIRKMKTLWGSCSTHRGVITINYYLYKVPLYCIDYIVFHELAHFLYRYHDRDFYGFIARHMPDWKERNRALKSEYPG